MSKENKDKANAAEARSRQTRGFMQQVRVAARRKYTPEEKVRIVLGGSVGKWQSMNSVAGKASSRERTTPGPRTLWRLGRSGLPGTL